MAVVEVLGMVVVDVALPMHIISNQTHLVDVTAVMIRVQEYVDTGLLALTQLDSNSEPAKTRSLLS